MAVYHYCQFFLCFECGSVTPPSLFGIEESYYHVWSNSSEDDE